MQHHQDVTRYAEAVADGVPPDCAADDSQLSPADRDVLANLRRLASIADLFATVSGGHRGGRDRPDLPPLPPGAEWGGLRVIELVGRGRFGQVYRAWDPALAREVALKLMTQRDGDDAQGSQEVEEGRLMARVRHPNVVSIYGARRLNGTTGLWMELVDGRTLAAELEDRGRFESKELIAAGIELCRALQAVHGAGLVHRDVKPQNVLRDRSGRIALGDFGTGRELDQDPQAPSGLAGTPAYLAPEIFDRRPATARSDIYSLGVLLFHLATKQYPVEGRSLRTFREAHASGTRTSLRTLRPDLPARLCAVVDTASSGDPGARYQTAEDMRAALELCQRSSTAFGSRPAVATVLVTGALLVGPIAWLGIRTPEADRPRLANPRQITSAAGVEADATWSPDGDRIAYVSHQSGKADIWVTQLHDGSAVNLTADRPGEDDSPSWSPDGRWIAFRSLRRYIYVVPADGGQPVLVASTTPRAFSNPRWSPDGTEVAAIRQEEDGANVIEIVSLGTGAARQLRIPGEPGNRYELSWSPDGRFFAYVRAMQVGEGVSRVFLLRASDGHEFAVTDWLWNDWSPTWSQDGRRLFYVSNRGGSVDLWQQRLAVDGTPEGDPMAVTMGIGMRQAAFSPDGRKLAYSKGRLMANVWRVPIGEDREVGWDDAEQLTFDGAFINTIDLFPDGTRLLISSDRAGTFDLWTVPVDGSAMTRLTADPAPDLAPRISPDERQIAFYSYRSGDRRIWVMPVEGGAPVQITDAPDRSDMFPTWSPDGRDLVFYGTRAGPAYEVFTVPAAGGDVRQITRGGASKFMPQWSPDGAWVAFQSADRHGVFRLWRMPASGGDPEQLTRNPAAYFRWSADGKRIYYRPAHENRDGDLRSPEVIFDQNLWVLDLATGHERRLTRLTGRPGTLGLSLAAGPAHAYFTWSQDVGDIWVMDVVTDDD